MKRRHRPPSEQAAVYRFWQEPLPGGGFTVRFDPPLDIPARTEVLIEPLEVDESTGAGLCSIRFRPL